MEMSAPEERASMKALVPDLAIVPRLLTRSALVTERGGRVSDLTRRRGCNGRLTSDSRVADGEGLGGDIGRDADEELLLRVERRGVGEGRVADLCARRGSRDVSARVPFSTVHFIPDGHRSNSRPYPERDTYFWKVRSFSRSFGARAAKKDGSGQGEGAYCRERRTSWR